MAQEQSKVVTRVAAVQDRRFRLENLLVEGVRSLLLKGPPGSGKTTLALELLNKVERGTYVSTRVPTQKLGIHYPWLTTADRIKEVGAVQTKADTIVSDLRFAAATDIVTEVLDALKEPTNRLLVMDSWDAIAKEMEPVDRLKAEKTVVAAVDAHGNSKIVFLSEEPNLTTTDYLVDGVITLYDSDFQGRRLRQMEISKLRGTLIPQKRYLFSLHNGRFNIIQPVSQPLQPTKSGSWKPTPHSEARYSTGSSDFDNLLGGGFKKGAIVLLELGRTLGPDWHLDLMRGIRLNFLLNGGGAYVIPTGGVTAEEVKESLIPYVDVAVLEKCLRVASFKNDSSDPCIFNIPRESFEESLKASFEKITELKRNTGGGVFVSVGVDSVELVYGAEVVKKTLRTIELRGREDIDLNIRIVKPGNQLTQPLCDISDLHLRLEEIHGAVVLFSEKPPSILQGVSYDYSEGFPRVVLTPIV